MDRHNQTALLFPNESCIAFSRSAVAMSRLPTLLLIRGLGHSGTTILDLALGAHPQVTGLGEASRILETPKPGEERRGPAVLRGSQRGERRCTCGASAMECPIWGPTLTWLTAHEEQRKEHDHRGHGREAHGESDVPCTEDRGGVGGAPQVTLAGDALDAPPGVVHQPPDPQGQPRQRQPGRTDAVRLRQLHVPLRRRHRRRHAVPICERATGGE